MVSLKLIALLFLYSAFGSGDAFIAPFIKNSKVKTTLLAGTVTDVDLDPKEAVKLFGRLAEKYIMLDSSGGMCCYSACSDCEYRLPDGGYIMSDQSAARPKWIPSYDERNFESTGKEHTTKWSTEVFANGLAVTREEFVSAVMGMKYEPPLGGPYVGASSGTFNNDAIVNAFFDKLSSGKVKLTKNRFGKSIKEMSGGEEGLTWNGFQKALLKK